MADQKISQLPLAGPLTGAEEFPLLQSGQNKGVLLNSILSFAGSSPSVAAQIGMQINAGSAVTPIQTRTLSTPPSSPSIGQNWIVGPSPTGAWAGKANNIAQWNGTAWAFTPPLDGYTILVMDEFELYSYKASLAAWQTLTSAPLAFRTYAALAAVTGAPANVQATVGADIIAATASRARSANVATIITQAAHSLTSGNKANIRGLSGTGYSADQVTVTVVDSVTFTYSNTGSNESTTSDLGGQVDRNGVYASNGAGGWNFVSDTDLTFFQKQTDFLRNFIAPNYVLAALPAASLGSGAIRYVQDGDSGAPCIEVSNGSTWLIGKLGGNGSVAGVTTAIADGVPGVNVGLDGGSYIDSKSKVLYPSKQSGVWSQGVPFSGSLVSSAQRTLDFRFGNFASDLTVSRAAVSNSGLATNLIYTDDPGFSYSTFGANTPVVRADLGIGIFHRAANYIANSNNAVTQTTPSLPAGIYILWGNGNGTIAAAANTAVGTGFGTISTLKGNFLTITITTPGTVDITITGSNIRAQLEHDPSGFNTPGPTPFIQTGATVPCDRPADFPTAGGGLLAALQQSSGAIIFDTANLGSVATTAAATLFKLNASGAQFFAKNSHAVTYYRSPDLANYENGGYQHFTAYDWYGSLYTNSRIKTGISWSGSTISVCAGNSQPVVSNYTFNGGASVTSASIGMALSTGYQPLDGWIVRIKTYASRPADSDLYSACTALTRTDIVYDWTSHAANLPKIRSAITRLAAGTGNALCVVCGDSNSVGIGVGGSNLFPGTWPVQMAALLQAAGINAKTNSWWGYDPSGGGYNSFDNRVTDAGSISSYGVGPGGSVANMAAGATRAFAVSDTTDTYVVYYFGGYGTFRVRDGVGGTILTTIDSSGAAGWRSAVVTAGSLAARTWVIEAVGSAHIAGAIATNSTAKEVSVCNWSRSGYTSGNFVQGSNVPEASIQYCLGQIAPDLTSIALGVNDMNTAVPIPTLQGNLESLHDTAKASGDVVFLGWHPTLPDDGLTHVTAPYATQAKYHAGARGSSAKKIAPYIDQWNGWNGPVGGAEPWIAAGQFGDIYLHLNAAGLAAYAAAHARLLTG